MTRTRSASSRQSSSQRFNVFEFNEEDESVEKASQEFLKTLERNDRRIRKRANSSSPSPVNKYKFLECFAACNGGVSKSDGTRCIEVDNIVIDVDSGSDHSGVSKSAHKGILKGLTESDASAGTDLNNEFPDSASLHMGRHTPFKKENIEFGYHALSNSSNFELQKQAINMISDDDDDNERRDIGCASNPTLCIQNQVPVLDKGFVGHELARLTRKVVIFPDFILFEDNYCTESRLIFTKNYIKIEGSTVNGAKGTFNAICFLPDIFSIKAEWYEKVETALVYIQLKSNVSGVGDTYQTTENLSGFNRLKFSVIDPCWSKVEEKIKSLNVRYQAIWKVILNADKEMDESGLSGKNNKVTQLLSISTDDGTFEDLIYPKGDSDPVIIGKREFELLQPGRFINDSIIDFYIKYLKSKIRLEDQYRFHFFNSFFFQKLTDLDKDQSREGKTAFLRVHKWTRNVNLFEKEYIFIPVNYSLHWSLIIICHPGQVVHFRDDENENSPKVPCILHMDSIKGSHRDLSNLIQSYLCEEWKDRHNETGDDTGSRFLKLQFITPELPQQENLYDCGLFLLHYVELFLQAASNDFSSVSISESSSFLNKNWFLPEEASLKRTHIQKLIHEIAEHSPNSPSDSIDTIKQEIGMDFLEERCSSPEICQQRVEELSDDSSSGTSTSSSMMSSEIEVVEVDQDIDFYKYPKEADKPDDPASSSDLMDCVADDSEDDNCMICTGMSEHSPPTCHYDGSTSAISVEVYDLDANACDESGPQPNAQADEWAPKWRGHSEGQVTIR